MSRKFTITLQETPEGDLFIEIPQEILDQLGLIEGDLLRYELDETLSGFRIYKDDE